jgi:transposase
MPYRPIPILLSSEDREMLVQWSRAGTSEHRMAERCQIILLAGDGLGTCEIARRLRTRSARVSKWRLRFAKEGMAGLNDEPTFRQTADL